MPRSWLGRVGHAASVSLLVAHIVTVVCFAQASPPDPTWIPGLYDNADGDDVVMFIVDLSVLADPFSAVPVVACTPPQEILPEAHAAVHPSCCGLPAERAPPLN
jgi:hypothetical protein